MLFFLGLNLCFYHATPDSVVPESPEENTGKNSTQKRVDLVSSAIPDALRVSSHHLYKDFPNLPPGLGSLESL